MILPGVSHWLRERRALFQVNFHVEVSLRDVYNADYAVYDLRIPDILQRAVALISLREVYNITNRRIR